MSFWEAGHTGWTPPETRPHIYPGITGPCCHTLICPGVVEKIEDGDQDIQHVTALQDKEEEFLGMREGTGGLGQGKDWLRPALSHLGWGDPMLSQSLDPVDPAKSSAPSLHVCRPPAGQSLLTLLKSQSFQKRTSSS